MTWITAIQAVGMGTAAVGMWFRLYVKLHNRRIK